MFAILGALILRGLAPEFYEQRHDDRWRRWWGRSFVAGSVLAPLFLGAFVGNWVVGAERSLTLPALLVGLATLALCVVDGAAFLAVKTRGDLRAAAPVYGVRAAGAYLLSVVLALAAFALDPRVAPRLASPVVVAAVVVSVAAVPGYVVAARRERRYLAVVAVAVSVAAFVSLAGGLLYPVVDPASGLTVASAAVSTLPLNVMTLFAVVLVPLVVGYFVVLYSTFRGPVDSEESY